MIVIWQIVHILLEIISKLPKYSTYHLGRDFHLHLFGLVHHEVQPLLLVQQVQQVRMDLEVLVLHVVQGFQLAQQDQLHHEGQVCQLQVRQQDQPLLLVRQVQPVQMVQESQMDLVAHGVQQVQPLQDLQQVQQVQMDLQVQLLL